MVDTDNKLPELDVGHLSSQLSSCTVGREIHLFKTLDSTMDEAKRMAEDGALEGAVVIAEEQTVGRGRFKRSWISEPGKDLLFSVVFRPDAAGAPYINMAAALSVCSTVGGATGLGYCNKVAQRRETGRAQGFGDSCREHGVTREYRVHRSRRGS